jgi:hypothetical protein
MFWEKDPIIRVLVDGKSFNQIKTNILRRNPELPSLLESYGCSIYGLDEIADWLYQTSRASNRKPQLQQKIRFGDLDGALELLGEIAPNSLLESRDDAAKGNFISNYSYAVPTTDAITEISRFFQDKGPILEVSAGLGLWSALLQLAGLDMIPSDAFASDGLEEAKESDTFTSVTHMDSIEAIHLNKTPCLFICWPTYNDPFAFESLKAFEGEYLLYIGEHYGCCADDHFFELLEKEWEEVTEIAHKRWRFAADSITIYQRKTIYPAVSEQTTSEATNPVVSEQTPITSPLKEMDSIDNQSTRSIRRTRRIALSKQGTANGGSAKVPQPAHAPSSKHIVISSQKSKPSKSIPDEDGWTLVKK